MDIIDSSRYLSEKMKSYYSYCIDNILRLLHRWYVYHIKNPDNIFIELHLNVECMSYAFISWTLQLKRDGENLNCFNIRIHKMDYG